MTLETFKNIEKLEADLREAADNLRANSKQNPLTQTICSVATSASHSASKVVGDPDIVPNTSRFKDESNFVCKLSTRFHSLALPGDRP